MATGLDQTYPVQHQSLRQQIIEHGGAVISEFCQIHCLYSTISHGVTE